ncbi:chemotaxis protein CheC [bacterium]|nr:chemotaxis protein CheC [bacterium]
MKLTNIQIDALKELGNIGAGHAATALASLIHREITIDIPQTNIVNRSNLHASLKDKEFFAVEFVILGEIPGKNVFFVEKSEGISMVSRLMTGKTDVVTQLDENGISTIKEIGNILTANYLGAMGDMINLLMIPSVPTFFSGTLEDIFIDIFETEINISEEIFIIKTNLSDKAREYTPYFILAPFNNGLKVILDKLGLV